MMYRIRIIAFIIILAIYLFRLYPLQTIITLIAFIGAYYAFRYYIPQAREEQMVKDARTLQREAALWTARVFLLSYDNIWKNLTLSNKYCILKLCGDGVTIRAKEKCTPYRSFRIVQSRVHSIETLWNMFCRYFSHNTSYDGLVEACKLYDVLIEEFHSASSHSKTHAAAPAVEKIDINNASEVEITALPGISIVMAKKLIKKRKEIYGFKSVDDVFLFLHLKSHLQEQLKDRICVNKMKGCKKVERSKERKIDL